MVIENLEGRRALKYIRNYFREHRELNHRQVLKMIVSEPETPPEVLRAISKVTCKVEFLECIASHYNTPSEVLLRLAKHSSKEVRLAVATNSNAAPIAVSPLTFDESPTVRFTLAENHNTEEIILQKLAADDNPFVSVRAIKTIERLHSNPA